MSKFAVRKFYTSESVSEGHPDKLSDFISDSILDEFLRQEPTSRVAVETLVTTGMAVVAGEVRAHTAHVDIQKTVREAVQRVGYTRANYGFDAEYSAVLVAIHEQSPEIASGVDHSEEWREMSEAERQKPENAYSMVGAGDQGLMFGYATDETPELMPLPISLAHGLTRRLAELRKDGTLPYLRPDAKAQVTVVRNGEPHSATETAVDTIVISTQHSDDVTQEQIRADMLEHVIPAVIPAELLNEQTRYFINPSGRFVIGGPHGDTGLTGRKIIVDTYGGAVPHGGGAFSGKDPTKVDRSAAYYARYVAKNIVAAGLARRALVEIAYAIGRAHPVSLRVDTYGTGTVSDEKLDELIAAHFDARPQAIIAQLDLQRPIYAQTAAYGHFGRPEFPWEQTDRAQALKEAAQG
ncbi:methionine adenosyltransferase [Deinococcus radiodurans]|jgi:methionine adenosyltransferase (EC 2.5.1.6)|uniref:S-adenosylmethionine synthase n=1 Tax=Deinococcus radiodurans (strain ATCC 13939 / DSM 20539 / JCM 16871 / CCUG 27074 / LMG 4051 / NBRC 15346 / NCIMB 9279 / VKM B-1422 / R1) TaxID=243230 RepID=METK_DEIRA|nr:methionine adenosyltransferase [Deinococcus radiodurans]Q9RWM6.1 RecName: Full=S-adenosylmethionine synthase; Short=AdoMet synthase; AltName: Full=MAT; AltName: Full=Methionine adenosyltransferase [Deinococcus radiodurans R1 = ATCC 13939 = DSM 20539]AAF10215.1 S-adenosylmethionine synthase [Deinococcus radiodurans R1 = ATCC 13939 = DSM 20539]QEM72584.1 methionine adenosyltransferase [Deinococcus radiodurans]QIP28803.1 methionine adenosyltransferase [Deinococcus radiodurans]UDK99818.1 methio